MRLRAGSNLKRLVEVQKFAEWILKISDGDIGEDNDRQAEVKIFEHIFFKYGCDPIKAIVDFVYLSLL